MSLVEDVGELAAVLAIFVAIALLWLAKGGARALASAFNVSVFGTHPFGGLVTAIENHVVSWLDDAIGGLQHLAVRLLSGLLDSFAVFIAIPLLLYEGIVALGKYVWAHTWHGDITDATKNVRVATAEALATAKEAAKLAHGIADSFNTRVVDTIDGYLHRSLGGTTTELGVALHALENSAKAANAAASSAEKTAAGALTAAKNAVVTEITNVTNDIVRETTSVIEQEIPGLAEAIGGIAAELPTLPGIALRDIEELLGKQDLATIGGLLAAIPLLRALVNTIASETGLENAECRAKIKGVCATDPNVWASLIGGLALFGLPFSLREIVEVARPVLHDLSGAVEEVVR